MRGATQAAPAREAGRVAGKSAGPWRKRELWSLASNTILGVVQETNSTRRHRRSRRQRGGRHPLSNDGPRPLCRGASAHQPRAVRAARRQRAAVRAAAGMKGLGRGPRTRRAGRTIKQRPRTQGPPALQKPLCGSSPRPTLGRCVAGPHKCLGLHSVHPPLPESPSAAGRHGLRCAADRRPTASGASFSAGQGTSCNVRCSSCDPGCLIHPPIAQ
jgi:hypothetical protein